MDVSRMFLVIVVGVGGLARADIVTRRWGPPAPPQSVQATTLSEPSVTTARVSILAGRQGPVLKFHLSDLPAGVKNLKAVHRAGLTFVTWQELDEPFASKPPTLDELKAALAKMEADRQVRYRIFRHRRPIDKRSIVDAELLAEVGPLSAYNTRGVSTDHVIHRRQLRAVEDGTYARGIAQEPFKVSPDSPEMGAVPVRRLAIENGKPLAAGLGLYVHQPEKAGPAYYAVVTCIDGVANMVDLGAGSSLREPVSEQVGLGEPVFQNVEDLKVFYDYPGQRRHYVQWCGPAKVGPGPLANRPNRYYNWSVYLPPAAAGKEPLALGIYFHDWRGLYLRPRWPHKADQILIATNDAPWPSFGYGYHESLGTLKSFSRGVVHDYTAARIDAFVAWVRKKYDIDPARISCHGSGTLGGTAAVHYALRHAEQVAWIVAGYFDPDPGTCPTTVQSGDRVLKTHLPQLEAVWGKRQWDLKNAAGVSIWKDRDLTSLVRGSHGTVTFRNVQQFKPRPGQRFSWTNMSLADGKVIQSGMASADQFGLVTMENLIILKGKNRLQLGRRQASP